MPRVKQAVWHVKRAIEGKNILEVACGQAEFSICAAEFAASVSCIDLDEFRLLPRVKECRNIEFRQMDAAHMQYKPASFDAVILYNAIGHLEEVMRQVLEECFRVVKEGGPVYIISSFRMDKQVIEHRLLPMLEQQGIKTEAETDKIFTYIKLMA